MNKAEEKLRTHVDQVITFCGNMQNLKTQGVPIDWEGLAQLVINTLKAGTMPDAPVDSDKGNPANDQQQREYQGTEHPANVARKRRLRK